MQQDRTEEQLVRNPVYEQVKVSHVDALSSHEAATAQLASLKQKREEAIVELKNINGLQKEADMKNQAIQIAEQYLAPYTQKFGEAELREQLDASELSDVVVEQEASLIVKKVSPKGSVFLPLGFLFSILTALAAALLFDNYAAVTDELIEQQIESTLEMPVLITLPRVYSSRNMVN